MDDELGARIALGAPHWHHTRDSEFTASESARANRPGQFSRSAHRRSTLGEALRTSR
jgi:hypothetical protein